MVQSPFAHEFPDLAKNANPEPSQAPLLTAPPSMSATILANWLPAPQPRPIETMTFAQSHVLTPFNWGGPDTGQLQQRLRSEVLGGLSQSDRSAIIGAVAQYAVSTDPDDALLAKRIDALLSADERQRILDAYAKFAAAQKAAYAKTQARFELMKAQMPANAEMPFPMQTMSDEPADAGALLLKVLIGGTAVTANFIGPGTGQVQP
jgi:hypothetical protein